MYSEGTKVVDWGRCARRGLNGFSVAIDKAIEVRRSHRCSLVEEEEEEEEEFNGFMQIACYYRDFEL